MKSFKTGVYPKSELDFARVFENFTRKLSPNTGCMTSFLGVAREESAGGSRKIKALVMESYQKHAKRALEKICRETKLKYGLNELLIVHAVGSFSPGQPIVLVLVSGPRRVAVFKGLREAVERYKKEPALFKQEIYTDGSSAWIS